MADTKIEYSDKVLEVTGGCTKCSQGCQNCWAIKEVWRMAHNPLLGDKWQGLVYKGYYGELNWTGDIKRFEDALDIPLRRKKPTRYFIDSKADLFHPKVPFEFIDKVRRVMWKCLQHTFLILTKRPNYLYEYCEAKNQGTGVWPNNVHIGVSISTPDEMWKATELSRIPAAVRWISFEPLLEDVGEIPLKNIHWVVVGGESGPGARPMHPDWVRNIRDQCVAGGVPLYFKQWGEWEIANKENAARNGYVVTESRQGYLTPYNSKRFMNINLDGSDYQDNPQPNSVAMARVGKKKAGYLLDGKEWKQLPERS